MFKGVHCDKPDALTSPREREGVFGVHRHISACRTFRGPQTCENFNKINALANKARLTTHHLHAKLATMHRAFSLILLVACAYAHASPAEPNPIVPTPLQEEENAGVISRLGETLHHKGSRVGETASHLVIRAMGFLGVPYRYGGISPETGFDCSGLVRAVFEESVGKVLPRRASEQAAATEIIEREDLKPGDLVFFNTMKRAFSHVGIYVGEGKFIHAPRAGGKVRVEDMRGRYWQTRFNGARRVPLDKAEPLSR